jgi:hypothetical protein
VNIEEKQRKMRARRALKGETPAQSAPAALVPLRPYSVREVSRLTGYSPQTVTKLFEREPGVLVLACKKRNGKRAGYRTIRIPRGVYERVIRRELHQYN